MPIDSVEKQTNATCIAGVLSSDDPLESSGKHNITHMPETITKDWIINNPMYKHLFHVIGHFKCKPVTIEMQSDAEPVWKAPMKH